MVHAKSHHPKPNQGPKGGPSARRKKAQRGGGHTGSTPPSEGDAGLLYGLHAVRAAWLNPDRACRRLLVTPSGASALAETLAEAAARGLKRPEPIPTMREDIDRLLPPGAVHQGVLLDATPLPAIDLEDLCRAAEARPADVVVVLDQVTDPHNLGAILRSAAAFGASAVIVQDRHAPDVTGVVAKTASGAVDAVPVIRAVNLARALERLQEAGYWCVGLAEDGARTLAEIGLPDRTALVLGAEGAGLRRLTMERCDEIARLPTSGPVGSLNVSNAAAVALYETARSRHQRVTAAVGPR